MGKKHGHLSPKGVDNRKRSLKNAVPKVRGAAKKQQVPHIIKRGNARLKTINNRGSKR